MITSKKDLQYYIAEDFKMFEYRIRAHKSDNTSYFKRKIVDIYYERFDKTLLFERTLRCLEYHTNMCKQTNTSNRAKHIYHFLKRIRYFLKYKKLSYNLGLTIPINTMGPGLLIAHYGSIVINRLCRVGSNCIIHSCVNIGINKGGVPQIGDNCYIGPGAKLFGAITIGNNVTIGANSVVNKSFPDNVVIAGIPAKIIRYKNE
jgi:serine O-acetyltransferase